MKLYKITPPLWARELTMQETLSALLLNETIGMFEAFGSAFHDRLKSKVMRIDLLSKYLGTRSFDWPRGKFCLARSPKYGERSGRLELFERQRLCLTSLVSLWSFCPCPKLMYSEGKPPALISLWPSGNPFKRKPQPLRLALSHGYDHSISYDSVSNLFLRDIPGRTEGLSRSGHIGWGHLWKDLLLFLESGYLQVYSSHWVWLLGCSFALDRESEHKLHCAVLLKIPRSMGEILTIHRSCRRNHNRIDSLSRRISKLAETPTPSHVAPSTGTLRSTMIRPVGKVEKKRTGEQSERVQKFFLNPPTETIRHGQVLSFWGFEILWEKVNSKGFYQPPKSSQSFKIFRWRLKSN